MNWRQKVGKVFLVTISLFVTCVLMAMLCALVIYIIQRGWRMLHDGSEFMAGLIIIVAGVSVNVVCVMILLEMSKTDGRLMASHSKE